MTKHKILVVDDEESLCEILQFNLEVEGYEVDTAYSAEQALGMHPERYSLILLDVMMGEMSGFKMARQLRAQPETAAVPIIFCTAKDTEDDTVAGLNIGADDYIAKPFSVREVLARVRSVLRRTAPQEGQSRAIAFEGLHMDLVRKICTVDGTPLALTKKEFEILALLLSNRGRIFSREEILHQVWNLIRRWQSLRQNMQRKSAKRSQQRQKREMRSLQKRYIFLSDVLVSASV